MRNFKRSLILGLTLILLLSCKSAKPFLESAEQILIEQNKPSQQESIQALKSVLDSGISHAITQLGKDGGFSKSLYRIPLPTALQKPADQLRQLGAGKYVDRFENSLNQAAEKAVPTALSLFKRATADLTVKDIVTILRGDNRAATQYFKQATESALKAKFLPLVKKSTSKVGVTKHYNKLVNKLSLLSVFGDNTLPATDINEYIVDQSVHALFEEIAIVEQKIRKDPMKSSKELIKKVFSYYK